MAIARNGKHTGRLASTTVEAISALDAMWQQVDTIRTRLRGELLTERPPNSFTQREYCQQFKVAHSTATGQLEAMLRQGVLQRHRVLIPDSAGRVAAQNVYVLTTQSAVAGA